LDYDVEVFQMGEIWTTESTLKDPMEVKSYRRHVEGWFLAAKDRGRVEVNLYWKPYQKALGRLADKVIVEGVDTGLWKYKGGMYTVRAGSGDCQEFLCYIGKCKK
jgi:hypothetical protein